MPRHSRDTVGGVTASVEGHLSSKNPAMFLCKSLTTGCQVIEHGRLAGRSVLLALAGVLALRIPTFALQTHTCQVPKQSHEEHKLTAIFRKINLP